MSVWAFAIAGNKNGQYAFPMSRFQVLLVFVGIVTIPLFAYENPLSDTAIRDAYFLGEANNHDTPEFLAQYTHALPMPKAGPHIAAITLDTPCTHIVRYSSTARNFSAVDAAAKSLNAPAMLRVRVRIDLTASYTPIISSDAKGTRLRAGGFWKDFKTKLMQAGTEFEAQQVRGEPIYIGTSPDGGGNTLSGVIMFLEYPANHVASDITSVEVLTPDGQMVRSEFDLKKLR